MIDLAGRQVLFLCDFGPAFTGADFRGGGVGGTEACVVLLAEEAVTRGARVTVANNVPVSTSERGVDYRASANPQPAGWPTSSSCGSNGPVPR